MAHHKYSELREQMSKERRAVNSAAVRTEYQKIQHKLAALKALSKDELVTRCYEAEERIEQLRRVSFGDLLDLLARMDAVERYQDD